MAWRLSYVDLGGAWGWRNMLGDHMDEVHRKLIDIEALTLGELMQRPGTKKIDVDSLDRDAKRRLEDLGHDDLDDLWELRLTGTQRIWGVIRGSIFYFLWWDPEHTVCPSVLRNT